MMTDNRKKIGKTLKQQRRMRNLTLQDLAAKSGVSASHISRVEMGERFPSARVLHSVAEPLGFGEGEILTLAGYLPSGSNSETGIRRPDPYVASMLALEPVKVQLAVLRILIMLKSIAKELL